MRGGSRQHPARSVPKAADRRFGPGGADAEDAFVDAAEGSLRNEAFEGFEAEGEFAERGTPWRGRGSGGRSRFAGAGTRGRR